MPRTIYCNFKRQQYQAKARGIAWELSYLEWLEIWHDSGHFEDRGCRLGQYVMHRHNDTGPYAMGNVAIMLVEEHNRLSGALGNLVQGSVRNYPRPAHRGPYKPRQKKPFAPAPSIAVELRRVRLFS